MRAVINGNRHNDHVLRATGPDRAPKFYRSFSPLAIGAVGKLPNDLLQRRIIIDMTRSPPDVTIDELDDRDSSFRWLAAIIKDKIKEWKSTVQLEPKPDCGAIKNRFRDNWRPLLAIADTFGYGDQIREVALRMTAGLPDDDVKVHLLEAIRDIFDALHVDRIFSAALVDHLHQREGEPWSEWMGINDDKPAGPITPTQLAQLLKPFKIYPKTISQLGSRASRGPSGQGYKREWFEKAWASYCRPRPNAPSHQRTAQLKMVK
jgi:hypothetical protein